MSRRTRQGSSKTSSAGNGPPVPYSRESTAGVGHITSHNVTIHQYSQLQNESSLEPGCSIYFVTPKGQTSANCSPKLIEVFNLCISNNITCHWTTETEILKLTPTPNNVFVLGQFEGEAYDYLLRIFHQKPEPDFLIIGPQVLKYVFLREEPELLNRGYPMLSLSMKNIVICLSGFRDTSLKDKLIKNVQLMGGMISLQLSMATTHLIASTPLTEKCIIAYGKKMPVMKEEWVEEVFKDGLNSVVHATDTLYSKYELPIFYKLVFCFSQISGPEKNSLKNIIEQNGGVVHADLRKRETNILVVPKATGDKYRHARTWHLPTVRPDWIIACKEAGHVVDIKDHSVSGENIILHSTPETDRVITGANIGNITSIAFVTSVVDQSYAPSIASQSQRYTHSTRRSSVAVGNYLDGCKVYLSGNQNLMDEAKKHINASGAMRLDRLSEAVTHVVVIGDKIPEHDDKVIKKLSQMPHIVGMDWLIESAQKSEKADEDIFAFVSRNANRHSDPPRPADKMPLDELNSRVEYTNDDGFNEYVEPNPVPIHKQVSGNEDNENDARSEVCEYGTSTGMTTDDTVPPVFQGKNFFLAFNDEDVDKAETAANYIRELEGELVSSMAKRIDYVIASNVCSKKDVKKYERIYTEEWLSDCYEERCIQRSIKFYHVPLFRFSGSNSILKDVVLAISAYTAAEKEYVAIIAQELGAVVQDVFSRKGKKRGSEIVLQTTHLICRCTDNEKYKAAVKWNVPVVHCEWILDCFKSRAYIDPAKYYVREGENLDHLTITPMTDLPRSRFSKDPMESAKSFHASSKSRTITPMGGTTGSSRTGSSASTLNNPTPTITPISAGNYEPVRPPQESVATPHVDEETAAEHETPNLSPKGEVKAEEAPFEFPVPPGRKTSSLKNLESLDVDTPPRGPGPSNSTPKGPYVTPSASRRHLSLETSELMFTPTQSQTPGRARSPLPESPLVTLEHLEGYYQLLLNESLPSPGPIREKMSIGPLKIGQTARVERELWEGIRARNPLTPESEALRLRVEQIKIDRCNLLNGKGPVHFGLTPEKCERDPVSERSGLDLDTTDNSDSSKDKSGINNGDLQFEFDVPSLPKNKSNKRSSDSLSEDETTVKESKKTRYTRSSKEKPNGGAGTSTEAAASTATAEPSKRSRGKK